MMTLDQIQNIRLFQGLATGTLEQLARRLQPRQFAAGTTILRQGEPTDALYFILSGSVRVVLTDPQQVRHTLVTLGPGEMFGERALLTGQPRTADVVAIAGVEVAILDRDDFQSLLPGCPELATNLCRLLAEQLGNWALRHQREERESREVLNNLVGWQFLPGFDSFPGISPWARKLNQRLRQLGENGRHVLILGERGTWKDLIARLIHQHGGGPVRPILHLDCANPPPVLRQAEPRTAGNQTTLLQEIAQEAALFGHEPESSLFVEGTQRGYLELADGGALILRNIEALTPRMQARLHHYLQQGKFSRRGESQLRSSQVRLLASSSEELPKLVAGGVFHAELFARLGRETITLKPLRERKKDIPAIARRLLEQANRKHHKQVQRLDQEALNLLLDYDWPLNGTELQQIIDRAVAVCNGPLISPEQIFLQGQSLAAGGRFNLLSLPAIDRIGRHPWFPGALRWLSVPGLLLVTAIAFWGPPRDNLGNLLVWGLWWPWLLLSVLLGARSWCSYCPLEAIGGWAARWRRPREAPRWLQRSGPWLAMAGFLAIMGMELAADMLTIPRHTGWLLLALLSATVLSDQLLGGRSWCKFLCPLGRMISQFSKLSLVELHSNNNVCTSQCQVDDCIKVKTCPMGLHPTAVNTSDHCIFCGSCVRHCPHHAIRLDLRPPLPALLQRRRRHWGPPLFSLAILAGVIATAALPAPWEGGAGSRFALLVGAQLALAAMVAAIGGRRNWGPSLRGIGTASLPLAFAGLFNIYFRQLIPSAEALPPLAARWMGLERWFDPASLAPDLGTLGYLIPLLTLLGGFSSHRLLRQLVDKGELPPRLRQPVQWLLLLATACLLVLL